MNNLLQFGLFLTILFASEQIVEILKLNLPPTILGMIILLILLMLKVIKLSWVENISIILINNLPILFIPTIVGVMEKLELLRGNIFNLLIVIIVTSILIISSTSVVIDKLITRRNQK